MLRLEEDDEENGDSGENKTSGILIEDEEFPGVNIEEIVSSAAAAASESGSSVPMMLDQFTHARRHLLKQGRLVAYVNPIDENSAPAGEEAELSEEEELKKSQLAMSLEELEDSRREPIAALATLQEDGYVARRTHSKNQPNALRLRCWQIRAVAPLASPSSPPSAYSASSAVIYAKSQLWPGAVTIVRQKQRAGFTHIYIGYGLKHEGAVYVPASPPAVMNEYEGPLQPRDNDEEEEQEDGEKVDKTFLEQDDVLPPPDLPQRDDDNEDSTHDDDD